MEKIFTTPYIKAILAAGAAALFASAVQAATTITDSQTVSGDGADNYIFAGGTDGKSYLLQTGTNTNIRNLKKVGSAYVGTMQVNENVDAIINFTTTPMDGYQSERNSGFRFGGSVQGTVDGSATLSGAGKDVSSLSFYGSNFDTGHVANDTAPTIAQDTMTISDLTFNFNGSNQFGSNYLVVENSTLNINRGYINTYTSSTTLTNSTLNYNSTNTTSKLGAASLSGSTLSVSNGTLTADSLSLANSSAIVNGGTLTMTSATFDNSSITVKSGATLTQSSSTEISYADWQNITVESGGNFTASSAALNLNGADGAVISGGNIRLKITDTDNYNTRRLYIIADSYNGTLDGGKLSARALYIGRDADGNTYDTTVNCQIQLNGGNLGALIIDGNSTINGSNTKINASQTNAWTASTAFHGNANYVGANATINAGASRICGGFIDGTININGTQYETANGWNYVFAFGVTGTTTGTTQRANMVLGENANINVTGNTTYFVGKSFNMTGNVTSNAGEGKIVSDANAGFYIRAFGSEYSTLTLNTTDAFAVGGALSQATANFTLESGKNANLVINANNNLGSFTFEGEGSKLGLSIAEGKVFNLGSFISGGEFTMSVALDDTLARGEFKINDMDSILSNYASQDEIVFTTAEGTARTLDVDLFLESVGGDYYVYTVAVPEPAEWAFIFGALALGFVAYRRRK